MRLMATTALTCAIIAFTTGSAVAQDVSVSSPSTNASSSGQVQIFVPDYFKDFQVSTAFDMVLHVPGFTFNGGDNARGFSGTSGNVLIDGQRPATKANLGDTLSNINAAQVEHLELITGGKSGIDMHGHRQIINVVRKKDAKPNFSVLGIYRGLDGRTHAGVLLFSYNANRNGKSTDITTDIYNYFDNSAVNARRLTTTASGADVLNIRQHAGGKGTELQASHARPLFGGKITFNGTYNPSDYEQSTTYLGTDTATEKYIEKDVPSELGGQFERKFSHNLSVNLNVLTRHDRNNATDIYTASTGTAEYRALNLTNERIFNGRLGWEKSDGLSFAIGTETAFNSLDRDSNFIMNATSPDVPTDHVRVQEDRTESFVSVNWKATPKLNFAGEMKVEASTISVPAANRSDSFTYYKPRFQAVYAFTDKTKLSWKTIRQVDQLSFNGFASSVQLETSHVTLGNSNLVPQKDWLNTLIFEQNFWDKGALSVAVEHYDYEDTADFIAVIENGNVYTANGNIGASQWDLLHLKLDAPLDRFRVPRGTFNLEWTYHHTRVKDPITDKYRRVSGIEPHTYSASFSQEFPKSGTSWGLYIESVGKNRNYLANEITDGFFNPWTEAWFQYTTTKKLQFKITLKNPLGLRFTEDRVVYEGLRDLTAVSYTQHTSKKIPPIIEMRLKKDL